MVIMIMKTINYAKVTKDMHGNLISNVFDDIYFSKEDGYKESLYVFFMNNNLPDRWNNTDDFTIFETGFGTGLNFLIAKNLWLQSRGDNELHFVSVEKYPLSETDMEYSWQFFPQELTEEKEEFFKQYKNLTIGLNIFKFKGFKLSLFVGDIEEFLPQINIEIGKIDSWFLDGFSPAKNPEMWQESLWKTMAKNTSKNGTFSTFSSAGFVKRGLSSAGFEVKKVKGFGRKREMLVGSFSLFE